MQAIDPTDLQHHTTIADIWTQACGVCFTASADYIRYNLLPVAGLEQQGRFALSKTGAPIGFVIASVLSNDAEASPASHGWIDAIAVLPVHQEQSNGSTLLAWAEEWLAAQGCDRASLGAGLHTFTPGLSVEIQSHQFFIERGYRNSDTDDVRLIHDVAADLASYESPPSVREIDGAVRPATENDQDNLMAFLRREFPGRWRFEAEDYLTNGARISDCMLLWTDRGVDGFCWLTFEDSVRPMERYYPYGLPRPWGQLGAIGVSADSRGKGLGAALLDTGLRRLRDNSVRGCVIDWTNLVDFYAKFGFTPYHSYMPFVKTLA